MYNYRKQTNSLDKTAQTHYYLRLRSKMGQSCGDSLPPATSYDAVFEKKAFLGALLKSATFSSEYVPLCLVKHIKSYINFSHSHFHTGSGIIFEKTLTCN